MGKMKMNPNEFALAAADPQAVVIGEAGKIVSEVVDPIATSVRDTKIARYQTNRDIHNEGQHTIQVKYDMVSNIVGDVCGVLQEITKTISAIGVEREKTRQVLMATTARICEAEEQTEQVCIKETETTERIKIQYIAEIKKAEIQLQKEMAEIQKEKERIFSDERKFDNALKMISSVVEDIISQNRYYMERIGSQSYSDELHKNNEQLIQLVGKIVELYIGAAQ